MKNRYLLAQIKERLFTRKAIVIYGARQVGKTTLVKNLLNEYPKDKVAYYSGDNPIEQQYFQNKSSFELYEVIKNKKIVVIDEAQYIQNIGSSIKLIVDNYPEIQLIVTGSSSFNLQSKISEPMTGRVYSFMMYPMSLEEIASERELNRIEIEGLLNELIIFGGYPGVSNESLDNKANFLKEIRDNYLYKDILSFENLKKSSIIENLLEALAWQVGSEVKFGELAQLLKVDYQTIAKYISILEQSFIIFKLRPFSKHPRKEINKSRKIYFYDNGILNAFRNNFSAYEQRTDKGVLFENFMVSERMKRNATFKFVPNKYFWRLYSDSEVDYLETIDGNMKAFEFKSNNLSPKFPNSFISMYPESENLVINHKNYLKFIYN